VNVDSVDRIVESRSRRSYTSLTVIGPAHHVADHNVTRRGSEESTKTTQNRAPFVYNARDLIGACREWRWRTPVQL